MLSAVVVDNACDFNEHSNNNNANGIFSNNFVRNFGNNLDNLEDINKFCARTRRIGLFDKFKT